MTKLRHFTFYSGAQSVQYFGLQPLIKILIEIRNANYDFLEDIFPFIWGSLY